MSSRFAGKHILKGIRYGGTQPVAGMHIKITGIRAAVGLQHDLRRADPGNPAALRGISRQQRRHIVKPAHAHLSAPGKFLKIQIEGGAQKPAVGFRLQGNRRGRRFHGIQAGNELQIIPAVFPQKPIHRRALPGHGFGNHREDVVRHPRLLQPANPRHHRRKAAAPRRRGPQIVLQFRRAIQGHSRKVSISLQKGRPFLVDQGGVGLNGTTHPQASGGILLHKGLELPVEFQSRQGGLAPLKDEIHALFRFPAGPAHHRLQRFPRHYAIGSPFPALGQVPVKAVFAGQVAQPGGGLDHQRQLPHGKTSFVKKSPTCAKSGLWI